MTHGAIHVKHAAFAALAIVPAGCVSVSGPCGVVIEHTSDGARTARMECDEGGSTLILAPARVIEAVEAHRASEGAP